MADNKKQTMTQIQIDDHSIVDVFGYAETSTRFERGKVYDVTNAEAKVLLAVTYDERSVFTRV